jgi:hypothetical protein
MVGNSSQSGRRKEGRKWKGKERRKECARFIKSD